ncbi:MAG: T9SS type A sorting domain-containing protein [Ignavibacteria bacterium]|nr:T9SS type A sorting domain-containing protein [Ignavibacteria bacterium]
MNIIKIIFLVTLSCFISNIAKAQWQAINNGVPANSNVRGITSNSQYLFCCAENHGVYRSSNQGLSWEQVNNGISNNSLWTIKFISPYLFAGTQFSVAFRSTSNGNNWDSSIVSGARNFIGHLSFIFAVSWYSGVYRTTNNGINWIQVNSGLSGSGYWPILSHSGILFLGAQSGGVFRSLNSGNNWTQVLTGQSVYALTEKAGAIFAGTGVNGIYKSTNGGNNWAPSNTGLPSNTTVYALWDPNITSYVIAGTTNGVYISSDYGNSWSSFNNGFSGTPTVTELYTDNTYLYAGTLGLGIYRRPLSTLKINLISANVPGNFELGQNYPNPFNPSTKIRFSLPNSGNAKLIVYDLSGKEVATLVNQHLDAGIYETDFDGSGLASGIYFYKLIAKDFSSTRKMILSK